VRLKGKSAPKSHSAISPVLRFARSPKIAKVGGGMTDRGGRTYDLESGAFLETACRLTRRFFSLKFSKFKRGALWQE
jgi:hypothetical protein